jgi:putative glycosyltransferase (TIGR04372 family)
LRKPYYFADWIKYSLLLEQSIDNVSTINCPDQEITRLLQIDKPYICIHVKEHDPDIRGVQPRGIKDIAPYGGMVEFLMQAGYDVVALGKNQKTLKSLKSFGAKAYGISPHQSVKNDFSLISGCEFYIGNNSGPYDIAIALRKPMLMINFIGISEVTVYKPLALYLMKRVYDQELGRVMTVAEYLKSEALYHHSSSFFESNAGRFTLIDNSDLEIMSACKEFLKRFTCFKLTGHHAQLNNVEQDSFLKKIDRTHGCMYFSRPLLAAVSFWRP